MVNLLVGHGKFVQRDIVIDLVHFTLNVEVNLILTNKVKDKSETENEAEEEWQQRPNAQQQVPDEIDKLTNLLVHL